MGVKGSEGGSRPEETAELSAAESQSKAAPSSSAGKKAEEAQALGGDAKETAKTVGADDGSATSS
jgi:hypothetical protein